MIELAEMQFELLNSEDDETGVAFGIGLPVSVDDGGFDPGELSWLTQDSINPYTGGRHFGDDVTTAPTWTWSLHVNEDEVIAALDTLARIRSAWKARQVARRPGEVMPLRYRVGQRTRRIYGRPRRFAAPPDNRILNGFVPISATFDPFNDLHYADTVSSTVLTYNFDTDGGFVLPTTLPITTLPQSERAAEVYNDGDEPTNPVIRFDGPVVDPKLVGPGWSVSLKMGLEAGEYVEIDTRPWKMTALRNGVASVGGRLGRRQNLSDVLIQPGMNTLRYSGASTTATSSCAVHWRSAYSSL